MEKWKSLQIIGHEEVECHNGGMRTDADGRSSRSGVS